MNMESCEEHCDSSECGQDVPIDDCMRLKDEVSMLKDKIAHLQSQLEESENEAVMAAEIGQQLLEQKTSLEALREQERNSYTSKLEDLTQENFDLMAKLESKERLLETHSQYNEDENIRKKREQEKEQMIAVYERNVSDLKVDLKKVKSAHDEEVSQLNLIIQQNKEVIENLQSNIAEVKKKNKAAEIKTSNDGEIEELKMTIEICHQAKRQVESKLCEMIHENERKNLESENLRQRLKEINEELKEKTKQMEDCYQHLEDAKCTIVELNLEVSNQQVELKSRGHLKKGNSLFGELEDKRVAAERELAIFKVRYDSLRKAYNNAKHELVQMRYQVVCFLQTRTGDVADRLRIEQLERALSTTKSESAKLSAKLKQLEQYKRDENPVIKVKEHMETFEGNEALKHYVNLLLVNAEESKHTNEILKKELESVRFRLIAKDDQLQETERKLYTATYQSEKSRNESVKVKLKVDEMKSKYDAEKEKNVELERLLKELGIIDPTSIPDKDFSAIMKEKKIVLPRYLLAAVADNEDANKTKDEDATKKVSSKTGEELKKKSSKIEDESRKNSLKSDNAEPKNWLEAERKRPAQVLTEKELNEKCCRLLMNTLPKELAKQYVKEYQDGGKADDVINEEKFSWRRKNRAQRDAAKSRKVSFKDEVDVHEIDQNENSMKCKEDPENDEVMYESSQITSKHVKEKKNDDSKVVVVDDKMEGETCKVQ